MSLFNQNTLLEDVCRNRINSAIKEANQIASGTFSSKTVEQLSSEIYGRYMYVVPTLDEDNKSTDMADVKIDVSRDPERWYTTPGPHYINGRRATISIPFTGDGELFSYPLNFFGPNVMGGEVRGNKVCVAFDLEPNQDVANIVDPYNKWLWELRGKIKNLTEQIQQYHAGLNAHVTSAVANRKAFIDKTNDDNDRLKNLLG